MEINEKYSYRGNECQDQDYSKEPAEDFNNTEIVGTIFLQVNGPKAIFPENMTGVVFKGCCLDNCIVPPGNTVTQYPDNPHHADHCSNRMMKIQNDGEYWLLDKNGKPVVPKSEHRFEKAGRSKDPADIPAVWNPFMDKVQYD